METDSERLARLRIRANRDHASYDRPGRMEIQDTDLRWLLDLAEGRAKAETVLAECRKHFEAAGAAVKEAREKATAAEALAGEAQGLLADAATTMAFLASCCRSGEDLSNADEEQLRNAHSAISSFLATDAAQQALGRTERGIE